LIYFTAFGHDLIILIDLLAMATRAKYNRVKAPEEKNEDKLDTDILMRFNDTYGKSITISGRYVSRALTLLFGEGKSFVTIKAAEKLMDRALWVAEVVRRKVEGLHQIVHVTEKKIVDVYEPT
jgi:DNA-binding protein